MSELDRAIAEKVMGEPEPDWYPPNIGFESSWSNWRSEWISGGYYDAVYGWQPLPFSSDLDLAMRAVDKHIDDTYTFESGPKWLRLGYDKYKTHSWSAWFDGGTRAYFVADSAPLAICLLLLALVEGEG